MLVSTRGMVPGPEESMLAEMSCPILPNSSPHPLEREAVHCTPPLPWLDCFHPTLARTTVRIQYETLDTRDHGKYQLLPKNEAVHLIELNEHDTEWREEIDAAYQALHATEHDTQSSRSSYNMTGASNASFNASASSLQSYDDWLHETPIVKFSFDLEKISAQDIGNPWEYEEEHEAYTKYDVFNLIVEFFVDTCCLGYKPKRSDACTRRCRKLGSSMTSSSLRNASRRLSSP